MDTSINPEEMKNLAITLGAPYAQQNELGDTLGRSNELGASLPAPSGPDLSIAPKPARGTLEGDKAERSRMLQTGAGEDQIYGKVTNSSFGQNHPLLGKVLGGLGQGVAKLGDIGLSAVAPALAINLPGTEYHHNAQLGRINSQIGSEQKEGQEQAQTAKIAEDTAEAPQRAADTHAQSEATVGNLDSETEQRNTAAANPTLLVGHAHAVNKALQEGRDPSTDPLVKAYEDRMIALQPSQNKPAGTKTVQLQVNGRPHQELIKEDTGDVVRDLGESGEKPPVTNINAGISALDRESSRYAKGHEKSLSDANAQLDKITDARNMINGSAESQALGVPKVLTALVSGAGSGVRITQPELNAIARARGLSGDIEGTLRSWAGQGKLTPTQQQQITGLLDDTKARILQKQQIHSEALDRINGGASREEIVQADKDARDKLGRLESGSGGGSPEGASDEVFAKDGKTLIGHVVKGKYVALGGK